MKEIEVEGKTVTLAVEKGLSDLGLRRDQVEVQILQEATPGFLGLGTKMARVRLREKIWSGAEGSKESSESIADNKYTDDLTSKKKRNEGGSSDRSGSSAPRRGRTDFKRPSSDQRSAPPRGRSFPGSAPARSGPHRSSGGRSSSGSGDASRRPLVHDAPPDTALACAETKKVLEEMLKLLEIPSPAITTSWDAEQVRVRAEVNSSDKESLLADGGRFLESVQFLVTLITSRRVTHPVAVQVDTGDYWREKEEEVILQVHQAMEMVKRTNQPVRLKPMDAVMRRLVHRTLAKHSEFETSSEGEGVWRKVVLRPKKGK